MENKQIFPSKFSGHGTHKPRNLDAAFVLTLVLYKT